MNKTMIIGKDEIYPFYDIRICYESEVNGMNFKYINRNTILRWKRNMKKFWRTQAEMKQHFGFRLQL